MIKLNAEHVDALTEIFNVGTGRAALGLSQIVGDAVHISVPAVQVLRCQDITTQLFGLEGGEFGTVTQHFSERFTAEAMLLFTEKHALEIVRDMMGTEVNIQEMAEFEIEAMCELGNIILNACMSAMADILGIGLKSSLPHYNFSSAEDILQRIKGVNASNYVLMLHIELDIEKRQTSGKLVFLLSSVSLDNFVEQLDQFLGNFE